MVCEQLELLQAVPINQAVVVPPAAQSASMEALASGCLVAAVVVVRPQMLLWAVLLGLMRLLLGILEQLLVVAPRMLLPIPVLAVMVAEAVPQEVLEEMALLAALAARSLPALAKPKWPPALTPETGGVGLRILLAVGPKGSSRYGA